MVKHCGFFLPIRNYYILPLSFLAGVLQCTPSSSRLVVLGSDYFISIVSLLTIVSALYLACLVFLVFVFACLTWKCPDQNHEPRWIFFNTFSITLIWFAWSLFRVELGYDEMSIVCANFACASVIMLSLFVRKLYLFSKISRQIRAQKQQLKQRLRNGNLPKRFSLLALC